MSENGEIYTAGKNFTPPPAVTAWTNSTSASKCLILASQTAIDSGSARAVAEKIEVLPTMRSEQNHFVIN